MLRPRSGLLFALFLAILLPLTSMAPAVAQEGSPVAVEQDDGVEATAEPGPSIPAVVAADEELPEESGNTPQNLTSQSVIYPVPNVYVTFYRVTTGGNTTAVDLTEAEAAPLPSGYRDDNARVLSLDTTATYDANINLCVIFDSGQFADPTEIELFRFDAPAWIAITGSLDATTVCGYTPVLGTFAVAEAGETPPPVSTESPVPLPTATDTPTSPPSETATSSTTASPTTTPSNTPEPTETPTATSTPTATPSDTPTPTDTPTSTPSATPSDTPTPTDTPTSTPSATATFTPEPTLTPSATPTVTPEPTLTPTATPSVTPEPTLTPSATPTVTETSTDEPTLTSTPTQTATETATSSPTPSETDTSTPTESPTVTVTPTDTPTATATETATTTPSSTMTETASPTPTSTPARTHFALPNVYLTFSTAVSGATSGQVLDGSGLPVIPSDYLSGNAWFFEVETTAAYSDRVKLCVVFEPAQFANTPALLRLEGSAWIPLDEQTDENGAYCGYAPALGSFALVERAPATVTPTASATPTATSTFTPSSTPTVTDTATASATPSPSETPSSTATATASDTATATATATETDTATVTPSSTATASSSPTPTPSSTATSTPTASPSVTATSSATPTSTATVTAQSFPTGTTLRATTRVNLRSGPGTSHSSRGVVASGATVTVTGPSIAAGGRSWVPVDASALGSGWIAGDYLAAMPATTPTLTPGVATTTRTPGNATSTRTPGAMSPTRTATRAAGGFIAGDSVRTTARVNLRSAPGTSSTVLGILPASANGTVTGAAVSSGGQLFYPVRFTGFAAGYVMSTYLQRVATTPARTLTPTATIASNPLRWTTEAVNFRSGPGTNYPVIEKLPAGTRVSVTGVPRRSGSYDWYPVIINGIGSGWIAGSFLSTLPPL